MAPTYVYSIAVSSSFVEELRTILDHFPDVDHLTFPNLLSALQFMEQKPPKLVVVHGGDYPRHWKILSQLIDSDTKLVVYHENILDQKEIKKAEALRVSVIDKLEMDYFLEQLPQIALEPSTLNESSQSDHDFNKLLLINTGKRIFVLETIAKNNHSITVKHVPSTLPTTFKALIMNPHSSDFDEELESIELINPLSQSTLSSGTNQDRQRILYFIK